MPSPTRRSPAARPRRPAALVAVAVAGLLAAGCGADDGGAPAPGVPLATDRVPLLQQAAAPGPDPFTASTSLTADVSPGGSPSPAASTTPGGPGGPGGPSAAVAGPEQPLRAVDGATPGLYGGTHSLPSCDVEQQTRFLTADKAKARAFAQAAGVTPAGLGTWLRDLTPVMLRADTRVTGHGYRDGVAVPYEAVLQTGSAVLVDRYGAPRVRCACGNPLRTPADPRRPTAHRGQAWPGYRADRVVLIGPTQQALDRLVLVNVLNDTWLERPTGSRGERDREPETPPAYEPRERHVADGPPSDGTVPEGAAPDGTSPEAGVRPFVPPAPVAPEAPEAPGTPEAPPPPAGEGDAPPDGTVPDAPEPDGFTPDGEAPPDEAGDGVGEVPEVSPDVPPDAPQPEAGPTDAPSGPDVLDGPY
ncbi:DUF6777 domain-containing protein [Streptomyces kanasensis]|uniref:DUF6777 domain-containing protein n=1 Tax=Streptomyces kanasensis TaxID=936756 RepID=UPI0012FF8048|nr:DUF6777 domain-containing protein [Streptomyces kanasensis]